jgi:nitrogen fixation/metabolism regulation signal transduction histidine kinase
MLDQADKKMLAAYAFPTFIDWGVIVEKNEAAAYSALAHMIGSLLVWLGLGIGAAILGAIFMAVSLTKPLLKLTVAVKSLAGGNLSTYVEGSERKDEIGTLSAAFNKMVADLNNYIDELTKTTKAKERAESELKLAWDIQ